MRIANTHESLNPIVIIHSTIIRDLASFGAIELTTVERFSTVAVDEVELE